MNNWYSLGGQACMTIWLWSCALVQCNALRHKTYNNTVTPKTNIFNLIQRHQIQFKRPEGGAKEAVGRVLRVTGGFESFNGPLALSRAHSVEKPNRPLCPRLPRLHAHPLCSLWTPISPYNSSWTQPFKLIDTIDITFTIPCAQTIKIPTIYLWNSNTGRLLYSLHFWCNNVGCCISDICISFTLA